MEFFLDLGNLLYSNWNLFSAHPMLFILYGALVAAITRLFVKKEKDIDLMNARNILEEELSRQRDEKHKLDLKNRKLMEENRKLQSDNKELGQRTRELNIERISYLRKAEQMEEIIKELKSMLAEFFASPS